MLISMDEKEVWTGCLHIIRGLPGSGKSTFAKTFAGEHVLEADMYFCRNPEGIYQWRADQLRYAHRWCLETAQTYMARREHVVLSNTNLTFEEVREYVDFAKRCGSIVDVYTMTEEYGSIHDVPESTLARMRERMESHEVFVEKVRAYQPD